jgi:two-component system, cell cycle sensor histidine kinase and response regulator CckA
MPVRHDRTFIGLLAAVAAVDLAGMSLLDRLVPPGSAWGGIARGLLLLLFTAPFLYAGAARRARPDERSGEEAGDLEARLWQAQKMEVVGRLSRGVAHDFNNHLAVILGYSEMLLHRLEPGSRLSDYAEEIRRAAQRAAAVARQLRTFSHQQAPAPQLLDLNEVLGNLETLLQRVLGEDIELVLLLAPAPGRVEADAAQVEQVIMHLALLARDAMPGGGKLMVETTAFDGEPAGCLPSPGSDPPAGPPPQHWVRLAISDTGQGQVPTDWVIPNPRRPFDPLAAPRGTAARGSGLGLRAVFAVVTQNEGRLGVESERGAGTTYRIYLPRLPEPAASEAEPGPSEGEPLAAPATVLLVEDDSRVRSLLRAILELEGYTVLEARDAEDALVISRRRTGPIELLVSDVGIPKLRGPELARRLAAARPELKLLFISGYHDEAIRLPEEIGPAAFIHKPFTSTAFARKVREIVE